MVGALSHSTVSVDPGDYSPSLEPIPIAINEHDQRRIPKTAKWRYLLDCQFVPGPVHVAIRGKCLAITAGYHTIVCNFGPGGNLRPMKLVDFEAMVAECVPGNNSNPRKANRLRSFLLPERFVEPGARTKSVHKINILAAVIHIISSSSLFQERDTRSGSALWNTRLWARFREGPDWNVEPNEALQGLDAWRTAVLDASILTPIIDVLLDVAGPAAGVGPHLANDLLYCLALHPGTPSLVICSDDETYSIYVHLCLSDISLVLCRPPEF
ncbi:hypothetical protein C8R46DRAFT_1325836 [Mycena filopes]|nr:hypothetical protein C8R46DRAFT_1325836 [Mycena filopes]